MSASPSVNALSSTKRPLDDEASPSAPTDQPDAKRPALDKVVKSEEVVETGQPESADAPVSAAADEVIVDSDAKLLVNGHSDLHGDTVVPDAPNGTAPSASAVLDTQPIQSTAGQHDNSASHGGMQHQGHQDETGWIHVRAVISSAEAATVIGKGGENVSQIRRLSGAKCTVSDYARGAVERILTVSGLVDATAKVNNLVRSPFQWTLTAAGVWLDYSHAQQRTSGGSFHPPVQNLSFTTAGASYPDRVHHRQVWYPHS